MCRGLISRCGHILCVLMHCRRCIWFSLLHSTPCEYFSRCNIVQRTIPRADEQSVPEGDDCVDSLVRADLDGDNGLDRDEFFRFLQNRTAECSELEQPTAAQKVLVFAVLSCSCVFENRSLLCCLGGAARIRLDGAKLHERDRERQDNAYLSIACRAPEVTTFSCAARTQQQLPTSTSDGANPRAGFARYFVGATMMLAVVLLHL